MVLLQKKPAIAKSQDATRTVGRDRQGVVLFFLSVLIFGGFLGSRLVYLQIIQGDHNRQLAENNRIRLIARPPDRGRIFDRKGNIMASSRIAHMVYLWPIAQSKDKWPATIARLSQMMGVSADEITKKLEQEGYNSPNLVRISSAISPKLVTLLAEHSLDLPGVQVDPEAVRYYPNGDIAAHLLGYTGEVTQEELKPRLDQGYRFGDVIGKMGVEAAFEEKLRGAWGGQQVEVDAVGKVLRILGQKSPQPGKPVHLTIDLDLQKVAEAALGDTQGAIVAMNPQNGEVLAMVSRPAYDPNVFSTRISEATWHRLNSQDKPFVNRALQAYPPASTFKILTTAAALESKKFSPNDVLNTYPYLDLGGILFWDHNKAGFGVIGFPEAMAYSSNTFFGQVGRRIGVESLAEWSRKFGFGSHTGIELANEEAKGLVPDPAWKQKVLHEIWYEGNTINMSIGQGDLQLNLLHVAMMTAVAANGGYLVQPHLLLDGAESKTWRKSLNLQPSTIAALQTGLRAVFEYGTAQGLELSVPAAGKSGTAEDHPRPTHAWFSAYAPVDNPEIVVVVFCENSGGGGGSVAGPRAAKVINEYIKIKQKDSAKTKN